MEEKKELNATNSVELLVTGITKQFWKIKKVSTKKNYVWKDFKTWKKNDGFKKNKKKLFHVVAIDYGIKKNILRYLSDFNCKYPYLLSFDR